MLKLITVTALTSLFLLILYAYIDDITLYTIGVPHQYNLSITFHAPLPVNNVHILDWCVYPCLVLLTLVTISIS